MDSRRSPTTRLLAGLAITLTAVAVYSGYTITQLHSLQELQARTIDRNRTDSLLLLRIQNNLNSVALTMRDMLDGSEPYPLTAWRGQFQRIRTDLEDALAQEERTSPLDRSSDQRRYLSDSVAQFWDALDRLFALAQSGQEKEARALIRLSLQARQEALSTAVSRLLVQNNETEQTAAAHTHGIYARAERNVYLFLAAMLVLISLTSGYLVQFNRRMFLQVAAISERRSELAQQLISIQENTFRSISRELHDDFGQILTAIGVMLQRAGKRPVAGRGPAPLECDPDLREVQEIVQSTLEKVRSLSHALHPAALEELGFESALDQYLPDFERQTGIAIQYEKLGTSREVDRSIAIHLYRVMQEALNNAARHSKSTRASVRLRFLADEVVLEVEDEGVGFGSGEKPGMGLVSMRERAEMVNGRVEFLDRDGGGALVRLTVPVAPEGAHA
ncbi:MAG TPA: ATP-binding protein [Bryobacteraceae bacterium]|nr:ATP-binding protein [Bryobacteraceae bacterium]